MTGKAVEKIVRLFSHISSVSNEHVSLLVKSFFEIFLADQFSAKTVRSILDDYEKLSRELKSRNSDSFPFIHEITEDTLFYCRDLNPELSIKKKFLVSMYLLRFIKLQEDAGRNIIEESAIPEIAQIFSIPPNEFSDCISFIGDKLFEVQNKNNILIISGTRLKGFSGIRYLFNEQLAGRISVLKINTSRLYLFKVSGDDPFELNNQHLFSRHIYFLNPGNSIRGKNISPIYFSDIEKLFTQSKGRDEIDFIIKDIEYTFPDSSTGINKFSISAQTGEMIAIMGASGAGKSTLMNLANGKIKPTGGNVFLNGFDIHENEEEIRGLIGYVPQDDVLFEELTVFQNLYYNAKLCLEKTDEESIGIKIDNILETLGLFDIQHLKAGSPMNKFISGGQRKRLNIAIELIREPSVIFVDEPTSGLSSSDSLKMIKLLKEQALTGKIVFINIHQPSSDIFKLFDRLLLLDYGGYPVYWGNPVESFPYLKKRLEIADSEKCECVTCGNINPEEILELIERRKIGTDGLETEERIISPKKWYSLYKEEVKTQPVQAELPKKRLVANQFVLPSVWKQFSIFSTRNFISKITNRPYVYISLLETPFLAVILGFFMRQTNPTTHEYVYYSNENIPAYLFMSIVVALFIGLIVSSEEIIKDRMILNREGFLGLSRTAYLHSKILYLFILSAAQMFFFIIIGNYILGVKEMHANYFFILWSTACFANMLGLIISSSFKSVIAIYITVPFLLIPQILLAGVVVNFDNLHHSLVSEKYTPVFSDLMPSRWGYEALAVTQYKDNNYEKLFFKTDIKGSDALYNINYKIPKLIELNDNYTSYFNSGRHKTDTLRLYSENLEIIKNEINEYSTLFPSRRYNDVENISPGKITKAMLSDINDYLYNIKHLYHVKWNSTQSGKDATISSKNEIMGKDGMTNFRKEFCNEQLSDLVLGEMEFIKFRINDKKIIRKFQPVLQLPDNPTGRAHLYAPYKKMGKWFIETPWFNFSVIWVMTLVLYFVLISGITSTFSSIKLFLKIRFF